MRSALLLLALASGALQEPPPAVVALESFEEKDGACTATFRCPWPAGSTIRVEMDRRATHMSWAPWMEPGADGVPVERVDLSVRETAITGRREFLTVEKGGVLVHSWKSAAAGVHRIRIIYDPGNQEKRDGRFPREMRSEHRLFAVPPGRVSDLLAGSARETIRFVRDYFSALRDAFQSVRTVEELQEKMRKHLIEAARKERTSQHPGTYSVLTDVSPFYATVPRKPVTENSTLEPNLLDMKEGAAVPGSVRESMVQGILLMDDLLAEALTLAPLTGGGVSRSAVESLAVELPGAMDELKKVLPAPRLARLWRVTKLDDLMTQASDTIRRMFEKGAADEAAVKELAEKLKAAARTIGHPRESLKE